MEKEVFECVCLEKIRTKKNIDRVVCYKCLEVWERDEDNFFVNKGKLKTYKRENRNFKGSECNITHTIYIKGFRTW